MYTFDSKHSAAINLSIAAAKLEELGEIELSAQAERMASYIEAGGVPAIELDARLRAAQIECDPTSVAALLEGKTVTCPKCAAEGSAALDEGVVYCLADACGFRITVAEESEPAAEEDDEDFEDVVAAIRAAGHDDIADAIEDDDDSEPLEDVVAAIRAAGHDDIADAIVRQAAGELTYIASGPLTHGEPYFMVSIYPSKPSFGPRGVGPDATHKGDAASAAKWLQELFAECVASGEKCKYVLLADKKDSNERDLAAELTRIGVKVKWDH